MEKKKTQKEIEAERYQKALKMCEESRRFWARKRNLEEDLKLIGDAEAYQAMLEERRGFIKDLEDLITRENNSREMLPWEYKPIGDYLYGTELFFQKCDLEKLEKAVG